MKMNYRCVSNPVMEEMVLFVYLIEELYKVEKNSFPLISEVDVRSFVERMNTLQNECQVPDKIYDPIMEPLVQSALAHLLFMKDRKMESPNIKAFHPNFLRFEFIEKLVASKASVTLGSFQLMEIKPSTASMDKGKLIQTVEELVLNRTLRALVATFVNKLQIEKDGDPLDKILGFVHSKNQTTKGLLYYIFLDLYMANVDPFIIDMLHKRDLKCFWVRCLNTAFLGFSDEKKPAKLQDLLNIVLPAWGLTAKVRSGSKGGRVIRPWNGKLYIDREGHLQWLRPESILRDM